jgi:hypothetical protein
LSLSERLHLWQVGVKPAYRPSGKKRYASMSSLEFGDTVELGSNPLRMREMKVRLGNA